MTQANSISTLQLARPAIHASSHRNHRRAGRLGADTFSKRYEVECVGVLKAIPK
jgi:hypothetical protein